MLRAAPRIDPDGHPSWSSIDSNLWIRTGWQASRLRRSNKSTGIYGHPRTATTVAADDPPSMHRWSSVLHATMVPVGVSHGDRS
jgi:hypothetical protein